MANDEIYEKNDGECANLRYADLSGANLIYADLSGAKRDECTSFYALQCPEEGEFISYKKAHGLIVKLLIREDAKRSSAATRKCRCTMIQMWIWRGGIKKWIMENS